MRNVIQTTVLASIVFASIGCAGGPGRWARNDDPQRFEELCSRPQIERGERRPVIDGIGWIVGIPNRIILWDMRVNNHKISPDTESAVTHYVDDQGLCETKVRLNQYAPIDEWRRLTANDEVGWGWRYTLGALTWLDEAVFPGRIFGGDRYNPYTNTISIFSDAPAIAVKEGSRARDVRSRRLPGTYAAVNSLPLVSMWYDTVATGYAFEYLENDMPEAEQEGYYLLYPAYGAHLGSDLASFTWLPNTVGAALGSIPGHILGRYEGSKLRREDSVRAQNSR